MPDLVTSPDGWQYDNIDGSTPNAGPILGRLLPFYGSILAGYNKVMSFGVLEELLTIAAAATSDTVLTNILPANCLIICVVGRVTVAIPTAGSFQVGDATTPTRFATGVLVAANTTFIGMTHLNPASTDAAGWRQLANASIRITPRNVGDTAGVTPGTNAGRVRLQVAYATFNPPAS